MKPIDKSNNYFVKNKNKCKLLENFYKDNLNSATYTNDEVMDIIENFYNKLKLKINEITK